MSHHETWGWAVGLADREVCQAGCVRKGRREDAPSFVVCATGVPCLCLCPPTHRGLMMMGGVVAACELPSVRAARLCMCVCV